MDFAALITLYGSDLQQVQAFVGVGWGGSDERYYVWEDDEVDGFGIREKGEFRPFGVADEFWQLQLRNCAKNYLTSRIYRRDVALAPSYGFSNLPAGSNKCNMFIAHRMVECGIGVPTFHTYYGHPLPPLANEWGSDAVIDGWALALAESYVQPGWVVVRPNPGDSGHCGIVDFDGAGIAAGRHIVNRAFSGFVQQGCVYRRRSP